MNKNKPQSIKLRGVQQNNLKNFDLDIPLGQLTVVTGLSGSGKSSLVFETLHAEGQRRYVETFSPYTRQFLEIMDRPKVDSVENIRPSIAIQQSNSVKNSRSTVGTMTELCDFFKVWFCHVSALYDPITGEKVDLDSPQTIWTKAFKTWPQKSILICFQINKPANLTWSEILKPLQNQGYLRAVVDNQVIRIENLQDEALGDHHLLVIQDRIPLQPKNRARFIEATTTALHFGQGEIHILALEGTPLGHFSEGLHCPKSGTLFDPAFPALFSFNSPIGACPECRGFGRIIEIDYNLIIPDKNLSIQDGTIRPFRGEAYGECLENLLKVAKRLKIRTNVAWKNLSDREKELIINGEPEYISGEKRWPDVWYGIKGFFSWMESKKYKMHIRILLSKYRSYTTCPQCDGNRLRPAALNWKWQKRTLPNLYQMSIKDLFTLLQKHHKTTGNHPVDLAAESIITRLTYLSEVGLGYLTLDRTSRTLSGGEVERVNLTTCLGTSLVETLFVLDEPSIGLHSRDISRLINVLRRLTDLGNTVVVVEHDESIMRAADSIIEIGPEPGSRGGQITFQGTLHEIIQSHSSLTGAYLNGTKGINPPEFRRSHKYENFIEFKGISKNNLRDLNVKIPLKKLVCISGVSGSGKSTLLNNAIYQGLLAHRGKCVDDQAQYKEIKSSSFFMPEPVLVDQSPLSKTPRSNPALYSEAWDSIRQLFATTTHAFSAGMTASHFSFNSGQGRCNHCQGLGYEKVEMQFLSDVFITCPVCDGKRFKSEVLSVFWNGYTIADILDMDIAKAIEVFSEYPRVLNKLYSLSDVGLNYLKLGQPLNTLSGGESQRLKLVRYLSQVEHSGSLALILLDEPTTGLHRHDIHRLIAVLQKLVDRGHSILVIEHQIDIIMSADWVIELGPEAGDEGGKIVAQGTPEDILKAKTATTPFLKDALNNKPQKNISFKNSQPYLAAAELKKKFGQASNPLVSKPTKANAVELIGAREHNLKNINVTIPHKKITVLTGVSGSGKSSLAFDIIFAEGQRRFMESISPYARQFVEQLPRPNIDQLTGIAPTVAIEQRVTRGSRKSTVATVTEVAQYLRLLFARIGVQHSPTSGKPVVALGIAALLKNLNNFLKKSAHKDIPHLYLCAPLVRGRKGHHQPLANWAESQNYELLCIDGKIISITNFKPLDRYKEHNIELIFANLGSQGHSTTLKAKQILLKKALDVGKGSCFIATHQCEILSWFSTTRTDPTTGEAFPELDPKHFSWNSYKGWCNTCRGHGLRYQWMNEDPKFPKLNESLPEGALCTDCQGSRLNRISRAVKVPFNGGAWLNLPQLLQLTPSGLLEKLENLDLDKRSQEIVQNLIPQIKERLQFMEQVGLNYLTLNRSSNTLSGGEAQRIRLAAQLSSNLSGVLYVLDEPSIGLHACDNERLIHSLQELRDKGNTLLVVEHDDETIRAADYIIDLGPSAGIHGGEVLANGSLTKIIKNKKSLTGKYLKQGIPHPIQGQYRELTKAYNARNKEPTWLVFKNTSLRNLKGDDLHLPLGRLIMVCGISGAGKSTLIRDLIKPSVEYAINKNQSRTPGIELLQKNVLPNDLFATEEKIPLKELINGNAFRKVIEVDQEPIGKTLRSTPATYIGAFDIIRQYFSSLTEAKKHGYEPTLFSFNTKGGRCERCLGAGRIKLEMNFLPDTYVTCESCNGLRYGAELSEVRWNGKNIGEVLNMSFEESADFFSFHSKLKALMNLMVQTGLGYLTLGQPSPSLSGGEAQRLKLVSELAHGLPTFRDQKRGTKFHNLYLLEEPTIGLHLSDCERLIHLLHQLVNQGHTVIVIEHHLDLLAEADYLVEIGPEGGEAGGHILYQGPPKGILKAKQSRTAPFLKDKLGN